MRESCMSFLCGVLEQARTGWNKPSSYCRSFTGVPLFDIFLPMERAVLELVGATCTSCAIGIDHMARRIKGVDEVYVDRGSGQIILDYDGAEGTVEKIQQFVIAIGYQANLISKEPVTTPEER